MKKLFARLLCALRGHRWVPAWCHHGFGCATCLRCGRQEVLRGLRSA